MINRVLEKVKEGCCTSEVCDHCCGTGVEMSNVSVGRMLAKIREDSGVTQKEVAEKMKISGQFLNDLERGRRRFGYRTIMDFLEALENLGVRYP